jgi:aminoglycoside 6'-N-acetyltransferase I
MGTEIRILGRGDEAVLANVASDVFDNDINSSLAAEFLADPRHHLSVAVDNGLVVGFASALHYVHPDKPAELWIDEVGVAPAYRNHGLAKLLLSVLFDVGRKYGCREAWVLTDRPNTAAVKLYESLGGKDTDHVMFTFNL